MIIFWIFLLHQKLYISPKRLLQELVYSFYLSSWDRLLLFRLHTSFSQSVWMLKTLSSDQWKNCPLSQQATGQSPTPSPHGRGLKADIVSAVSVKVAQLCPTLCHPMDCTVRGILQAINTRVGSLSLLQGIIPTQGLNPGLPCCRWILYQLSHKGSPRLSQEEAKSWPSA